jgi:environmental stress-induced protein Ves
VSWQNTAKNSTMKIIPPSAFVTMPWKNGGGITHEILKQEHGGKLLWRLSIAEVASDGPFSLFPGLSRILTVIEGARLCQRPFRAVGPSQASASAAMCATST